MKLLGISTHALLASIWGTASARAVDSPADKPLQGETSVPYNSSSKFPLYPSLSDMASLPNPDHLAKRSDLVDSPPDPVGPSPTG